jgi:hypothetical protein
MRALTSSRPPVSQRDVSVVLGARAFSGAGSAILRGSSSVSSGILPRRLVRSVRRRSGSRGVLGPFTRKVAAVRRFVAEVCLGVAPVGRDVALLAYLIAPLARIIALAVRRHAHRRPSHARCRPGDAGRRRRRGRRLAAIKVLDSRTVAMWVRLPPAVPRHVCEFRFADLVIRLLAGLVSRPVDLGEVSGRNSPVRGHRRLEPRGQPGERLLGRFPQGCSAAWKAAARFGVSRAWAAGTGVEAPCSTSAVEVRAVYGASRRT